MGNFLSRFMSDEHGATAIEYGLIAGLVALVIIVAVRTLGTTMQTTFDDVATKMAP